MNESAGQNTSSIHGKIIYQHVGNWVSPPEHAEDNPKDGPFVAVIVIGSIFLLLTISILVTVFILIRKHAKKQCQNRTVKTVNFETVGWDIYVNPSNELQCSVDSDSFEDMSDVSIEIEFEEEPQETIGQTTNGWIATNSYLCPKHSRIALFEGSEIRTSIYQV